MFDVLSLRTRGSSAWRTAASRVLVQGAELYLSKMHGQPFRLTNDFMVDTTPFAGKTPPTVTMRALSEYNSFTAGRKAARLRIGEIELH